MYTLLKPLFVQEVLLRRGAGIFTPQDFQRIFRASPIQARYFLEKNAREDLFLRLKKELYALKINPPSEEEIANRLYRPSYISL